MQLNRELMDELEVLSHFDLSTTQQGIKIHHDAAPEIVSAAERLFHKGLISQKDGGYLTDLGHELAEHVDSALTILTSQACMEH